MAFFATMARGVERIAKLFGSTAYDRGRGRNESAANIEHIAFMVNERDRFAAFVRC